MRTTRQWFEDELPADIAALAITNSRPGALETKRATLEEALSLSFVWTNTNEGFYFWHEVHGCSDYREIPYPFTKQVAEWKADSARLSKIEDAERVHADGSQHWEIFTDPGDPKMSFREAIDQWGAEE